MDTQRDAGAMALFEYVMLDHCVNRGYVEKKNDKLISYALQVQLNTFCYVNYWPQKYMW